MGIPTHRALHQIATANERRNESVSLCIYLGITGTRCQMIGCTTARTLEDFKHTQTRNYTPVLQVSTTISIFL